MMKKIRLLLITFTILLMQSNAFAIGTLKNTVIVSSANHFVVNYKNYTGIDQPPVTPNSDLNSTPVLGIYGFNFYNTVTANLYAPTDLNRSTGASVSVNFLQNIFNISNDITPITVQVTGSRVLVTGNAGTLNQWMFAVVNPTLNLTADTVSNNWLPQIKPAGDAVRASEVGTSLNVFIPGSTTDNTQYIGFNENVYGGYNSYTYFISATIAGPTLRLANRISQISSSLAGYTGGPNDLVPGAKVTYTIVIVNDGNATASTLNITERIPANTTFYSIESPSDHNNFSYLDLNNIDNTGSYGTSANIKSVVFKKNTLSGNGGTATFNYSVTVN